MTAVAGRRVFAGRSGQWRGCLTDSPSISLINNAIGGKIEFELKKHGMNRIQIPSLPQSTLPPAHECNNTCAQRSGMKSDHACDISSGIRLLLDLSASRSVGLAKSGHLSFPSEADGSARRPQKLNSNGGHLRATLKWAL